MQISYLKIMNQFVDAVDGLALFEIAFAAAGIDHLIAVAFERAGKTSGGAGVFSASYSFGFAPRFLKMLFNMDTT